MSPQSYIFSDHPSPGEELSSPEPHSRTAAFSLDDDDDEEDIILKYSNHNSNTDATTSHFPEQPEFAFENDDVGSGFFPTAQSPFARVSNQGHKNRKEEQQTFPISGRLSAQECHAVSQNAPSFPTDNTAKDGYFENKLDSSMNENSFHLTNQLLRNMSSGQYSIQSAASSRSNNTNTVVDRHFIHGLRLIQQDRSILDDHSENDDDDDDPEHENNQEGDEIAGLLKGLTEDSSIVKAINEKDTKAKNRIREILNLSNSSDDDLEQNETGMKNQDNFVDTAEQMDGPETDDMSSRRGTDEPSTPTSSFPVQERRQSVSKDDVNVSFQSSNSCASPLPTVSPKKATQLPMSPTAVSVVSLQSNETKSEAIVDEKDESNVSTSMTEESSPSSPSNSFLRFPVLQNLQPMHGTEGTELLFIAMPSDSSPAAVSNYNSSRRSIVDTEDSVLLAHQSRNSDNSSKKKVVTFDEENSQFDKVVITPEHHDNELTRPCPSFDGDASEISNSVFSGLSTSRECIEKADHGPTAAPQNFVEVMIDKVWRTVFCEEQPQQQERKAIDHKPLSTSSSMDEIEKSAAGVNSYFCMQLMGRPGCPSISRTLTDHDEATMVVKQTIDQKSYHHHSKKPQQQSGKNRTCSSKKHKDRKER